MADDPEAPISTMAVRLANNTQRVVLYEYEEVIVFLKPGARLQGVFTGSENPPKSTGTMADWPDLTPETKA